MCPTDWIPVFPIFADTFCRTANRWKVKRFMADLQKILEKNQAGLFPIIYMKEGKLVTMYVLTPKYTEFLNTEWAKMHMEK